jgi:signal transduction histidine kinase
MLDDLGLVAAIRNFKLNDTLRLEVDAPDPLPKLPAALEVALYRIASEALHNVVRHANATQCWLCLQIHENQITLSITDNGTSPPDHYTAGIGLHSMRERAEELSGTLTIQPGEQGGTQVTAQLPITF